MFEMASVSFNKVRLQYYVAKDLVRARWLHSLLTHPAQLFGTTLIGVNTALLIGSESARRLYEAFGIDPDFAPLTQIVLVMIFSELSPMFAGRRHAEHAALLLVPIFYPLSKLLLPVIYLFDQLCRIVNRLLGFPKWGRIYLSREELQGLIEEREEGASKVIGNIFSLKSKVAKELMTPLNQVQMIPSYCNIAELRRLLSLRYSSGVPIYHHHPQNIVAIAYPRDLIRLQDKEQVRPHARAAWFISEKASILQILKQFRSNNQDLAVVLSESGGATGILTLDAIAEEIVGLSRKALANSSAPAGPEIFLERTFPAEMAVSAFNAKYGAALPLEDSDETLGELIARSLGHLPGEGETVRFNDLEIVVEEASLLGAKSLLVRSLI